MAELEEGRHREAQVHIQVVVVDIVVEVGEVEEEEGRRHDIHLDSCASVFLSCHHLPVAHRGVAG